MAKTPSSLGKEIESLTRANEKLKAENSLLKTQVGHQQHAFGKGWRMVLIGFCVAAATACLIVGNILFWAGDTLLNTEKYTKTVTAVVEDEAVQAGIAHYATTQLFSNVDVTQVVQDALPPRASFLAQPLTTQLQKGAETTLQRILASDKFQTTWVQVNTTAHDKFITAVKNSSGDGTINIQDVYAQLAQNLSSTKLSFLADKPLPAKVGDIQLIQADWLPEARTVIKNINWLKPVSLLLIVVFGGVAIALSRNRRKLVIILSSFFSLSLLASLVSYRILQTVLISRTDQVYQLAVDRASGIVLQPLVDQTFTLLAISLLILVIAWLTGPYTVAAKLRDRLRTFFSGQLHEAFFGKHETKFTRWVASHQRLLEWLVVVLVGIIMLIVKLTPKLVAVYGVIILLFVLMIEIVAAPQSKSRR